MQTSTSVKKTFTLVLNEDEAKWIHENMQNPLHGVHPADEPLEEAQIRKALFNATTDYK